MCVVAGDDAFGLFDLPPLAADALRALLGGLVGEGGRRQSHFICSSGRDVMVLVPEREAIAQVAGLRNGAAMPI